MYLKPATFISSKICHIFWCLLAFGVIQKKVHVFAGQPSIMLAAGASIIVLTWVRLASPEQELKLSCTFQIWSIQRSLLTLGLTIGRVFLDGVCIKPSVHLETNIFNCVTGGYIVLFKQDVLVDLKSLSTKAYFICTHKYFTVRK